MKGNYTIVVMPPNGTVRSYVLSAWGWRLAISGFVLICLAVVVSCAWAIWLREQKQDVDAELNTLKTDHEQTTQELEKARQYLEKVKELDSQIRNVLFEEGETTGLGQGGFGAEALDESELAVTPTLQTSDLSEEQLASLDTVAYAKLMLDRLQQLDVGIDAKLDLYRGFPSILPLQTDPDTKSYWFSSGFGYRTHPLTGRREFHKGLDISTRRGTPIIAPADGKIIAIGTDPYLGNRIKLEHHSFQGTHVTTFGHMKAFAEGLKKGDLVKRYQVIGYVGRSGRTTGSHLHYEVSTNGIAKNPKLYIIRENQK